MDRRTPSPCLVGFESVARFWDGNLSVFVAKIKPGELYVSANADEAISTVLGSCIAVCLRDADSGIGGMNHFMLPNHGNIFDKSSKNSISGEASRYGNWAMEYLINNILKCGGKRRNLEAKIFGGSTIQRGGTDVGLRNIEFINDYMYNENIRVVSKDVGGNQPRNIIYYPNNGKVLLKKLASMREDNVDMVEKAFMDKISGESKKGGEIDLF